MYRRRRKLNIIMTLIHIGLVVGIVGVIFRVVMTLMRAALNFFNSADGRIVTLGAAMVITFVVIKKVWDLIVRIRRHQRRRATIAKLMPSADRNEYIIEREDYRRGSPKESYYRKTFCLYLLEAFNNSCAKCGSKENGMDIDHFIFSKNEGGCFMMRHSEGYLINNAIPLCQTCNRSKSDESYKSYFSESELLTILERNVLMTKRLNQRLIFNGNGEIIKQKMAG